MGRLLVKLEGANQLTNDLFVDVEDLFMGSCSVGICSAAIGCIALGLLFVPFMSLTLQIRGRSGSPRNA